MTVIALVGSKGSPGVTTMSLALGAAWPRRRVAVAECDPSGGDVAARFGLTGFPGMASFVLSLRRQSMETMSTPVLTRHTQGLPGGLDVLVGPGAGDSALALDEEVAAIGHSFLTNTRREAIDLLVDCGRLAAGAPGQHLLLKDADLVVLVARPEPTSLVSAHWAATRIIDDRPEQRRPLLVTVGHSPLHPGEMAEALAIELLGTVPLDPVAAAMLSGRPGRPRALSRSVLISVAARLAHILETRCRGETLDPASDEALDTTNDQEHRDAS